MPWTPNDAEKHTHKATTWALKELWAKVANECLERTGDEGRGEHIRARWLIIPNIGISFLVQMAIALRAVDYVFGVGKRSPPKEVNQDTMKAAAVHKSGAHFAIANEWRLAQFYAT